MRGRDRRSGSGGCQHRWVVHLLTSGAILIAAAGVQGQLICSGDPSRRIFAGGSAEGQDGGSCRQFDGDQATCTLAFHLGSTGIASCFYQASDNTCRGCGRNNESSGDCTNTCVPTTCADDPTRIISAGGPGTEACRQFNGDPNSCNQGFHHGRGGVASCFYDNVSNECHGCGPNNESEGDCTNTCVPQPTCAQDSSRTIFAGGPRSDACHQFDGDPDTCDLAFHRGRFDLYTSCFSAIDCVPCGAGSDGNDAKAGGAAAGSPGNDTPLGCVNSCVPPPICLDQSRTTFAGGPRTDACRRFNGDQTACEKAFHLGHDGVATCWYDTSSDECLGCGFRNEGRGLCSNTCIAPPTCAEDPTRTNFAGGPDAGQSGGACRQYDNDQTTCETSFHRAADGTPASCFYQTSDNTCRGCGVRNETRGSCTNTCMPPTCANDPSRTIFAGGLGTNACHQFDNDQTSCEAAFHRTNQDLFASCFYDNGSCKGCGPSNELDGLCSNTCLPAVTCPMDQTRTIFVGREDQEGCHHFDNDQTGCLQAFHEGRAGVESCWYETATDRCRGCGPANLNQGFCTNTCAPAPFCTTDPSRTFEGCSQLDGDATACNHAFEAGFNGPVSCFPIARCSGCGLFNQANGVCVNTCAQAATEAGLCNDGLDNDGDGTIDCGDVDCVGDPSCTAPAPTLSWPGLFAALVLLAAIAAYRFNRSRFVSKE